MTEKQYFTQQYEEDEDVSEDLDKKPEQMPAGVFYDEDGLPRWQPHHSWQWNIDDIEHAMGADKLRIADLERQRDDFAAALRAIHDAGSISYLREAGYAYEDGDLADFAEWLRKTAADALAQLKGDERG